MQRPSLSFRNRTVLVTGASSGIGLEAALAFAAAGSNVVLVARRAKALAGVATRARKSGAKVLVAPADVTKPAEVAASFRKAVKRFGRVDIVVNNAGVLIPSEVVSMKSADLQAMLDVNLIGALHVMQQAVTLMREQGRGHIVNVASLAGRRGFSPLGGYCATKFGLIGLTEALRTELVGERIHVSIVLPGAVDTAMVSAIERDPGNRRAVAAGAQHAAILGGLVDLPGDPIQAGRDRRASRRGAARKAGLAGAGHD